MSIGLVIEIIVAALLVVTTAYCFLLDRKLRELRTGQDGLRDLIGALDGATEKAQLSIRHLKSLAEEAGGALSGNVSQARKIADELSVMIEVGDRIAGRLEGGAGTAKAAGDHIGLVKSTEKQAAPAINEKLDPAPDDEEITLPSLRGVK